LYNQYLDLVFNDMESELYFPTPLLSSSPLLLPSKYTLTTSPFQIYPHEYVTKKSKEHSETLQFQAITYSKTIQIIG
jgi:hypothetical protein